MTRFIIECFQQLKFLIVKISIKVATLPTDCKLDTLSTTDDHPDL